MAIYSQNNDHDGALKLMELELVEPALFLDLAPERAKTAFADAVLLVEYRNRHGNRERFLRRR